MTTNGPIASLDAKRNSQEPAGNNNNNDNHDNNVRPFSSASAAKTTTTAIIEGTITNNTTDNMPPQLASTSPTPSNNSTTMSSDNVAAAAVNQRQQEDEDDGSFKSSQQQQQHQHQLRVPVVMRDARFRAGRTLVQSGRAAEGATDLFATLLEEARNKYGEAHIETAAAYYEYGNAIFRSILATIDPTEEETKEDGNGEVAAVTVSTVTTTENDKKKQTSNTVKITTKQSRTADDEMGDDEEEEDDDVQLALEMMETAWSILDEYVTTSTAQTQSSAKVVDYAEWALEEIPRVLVGIGDVLSHLTRHADAADALSRALPYREQALTNLLEKHRLQQQAKPSRVITNDDDGLPKELISFEHLKCRRQLAEVNILVAEELLACPADQDVVTSESKDVLVTAAERVDFAGGYYDKARDELQETVYLLGKLSARIMGTSNNAPKVAEFAKAKEDVCFLATLIMGVGENLSVLDEAKARQEAMTQNTQQPPIKKQRT